MILDLTVFQEETLDIKMKDGTLHVRKPTERMVIDAIRMKDIVKDTPPEEVAAQMNLMVWKILNNNTDGVKFEMHAVAALSRDLKEKIVYAYVDFIKSIQANPTCSSRASLAKRLKAAMRSFCAAFARSWNTPA